MSGKFVYLAVLVIVFMGVSGLAINVQDVEASGTIYIRADGSVEGTDKILRSGDIYTFADNINDSIVVEKDDIVIDGAGYTVQGTGAWGSSGIYLWDRSNVTIKNMEIKGFDDGIYLGLHSGYNTVSGNTLIENDYDGIYLYGSSNNIISGNTITNNNDHGIYFRWSSNNIIYGNTITNNDDGIYFYSLSNNNSISGNIITNNNDCGIYFYPYENNNNSFFGNTVTNNSRGIFLSSSSNNTIISGNTIRNNEDAICLPSYNNSVLGNTITNNGRGISILYSSNNVIYNNNFVDNTQQVYDYSWDNPNYPSSVNVWDFDYPLGGNYWSNYTDVDSDHDGIGDSEHVIDANNSDHHPLMGMFHSYNTSVGKHVDMISNSTIDSFEYFEESTVIRIYVSYDEEVTPTFGFCRVCISTDLLPPPHHIIIDDGLTPVLYNRTVAENQTHKWIYFAYQHSAHRIDIVSEFPSFLILPLFMIATLLAVIIYRRKHVESR